MSKLHVFEGTDVVLDLDEVRIISEEGVLFKGSDRVFIIGKEAVAAIVKELRESSRGQRTATPAKTDPIGLMELNSHVV